MTTSPTRGSMTLDPSRLRDPNWLHWAATIPLLAAHVLHLPHALPAAIALCLAMTLFYYARLRSLRAIPVQLRLAFTLLLLSGILPGMGWMHYSQLLGLTAMTTFGYCPLLRTLILLPWNRTEPFSTSLLRRALLSPPPPGGLLRPTAAHSASIPTCAAP